MCFRYLSSLGVVVGVDVVMLSFNSFELFDSEPVRAPLWESHVDHPKRCVCVCVSITVGSIFYGKLQVVLECARFWDILRMFALNDLVSGPTRTTWICPWVSDRCAIWMSLAAWEGGREVTALQLKHHRTNSIFSFNFLYWAFLNFLIQPPPNHSKASFRAAKSHIAFSRTACCSVPWVVKTSSYPTFFRWFWSYLKVTSYYSISMYISKSTLIPTSYTSPARPPYIHKKNKKQFSQKYVQKTIISRINFIQTFPTNYSTKLSRFFLCLLDTMCLVHPHFLTVHLQTSHSISIWLYAFL